MEYPVAAGFRPGTPALPYRVYYVFTNGGLGDFICWMQAIRYLATECTWIHGVLVVPNFFQSLAHRWLAEFPKWQAITHQEFHDTAENDELSKGPFQFAMLGINAMGAHMIDCGFNYFAGKMPPPEWNFYPELALPRHPSFRLLRKYAVLTVNGSEANRRVPGHYWTPIVHHLLNLNITPVLLGKSVIDEGSFKKSSYSDSTLVVDNCLDFRDKTNLTEALQIMAHAEMVIGLDNGLLHLAAVSEVPIVFGYNITTIEHREPRRRSGHTENVTLKREELACIACQSNTQNLIGFDFRTCFYKDLKCIDLLFSGGAIRWITAIDNIIRSKQHVRVHQENVPRDKESS